MPGGRFGRGLREVFVARRMRGLCAAGLVACALRGVGGQETEKVQPMAADAHPSFEVAAIQRSDPADQRHRFTVDGRRVLLENQTVKVMMQMAYGVHAKQIANAPSWVDSERFDIEGLPDAKGQPSAVQFQEMVRKLLEQRFGLRFHTATREMSRYVLTVAKGGPKLKPTKSPPNALPNEDGSGDGTSMTLRMENVSMGDLAGNLQGALDRPVVDETGLHGRYDFTLRWLRDDAPAAADAESNLPRLFTALQEQLGLKVEPSKGEVEMLVIDHAEPPSAN